MKKILFILLFLFSLSAFSYEEVWKLGEHYIPLEKNEVKGLLVSKFCTKSPCDAMKILKKVSLKQLDEKKLIGGKNPGAVLCTENVKGRIVYLKDLNGNENTFCFFKDKSMVSTGTLYVYASKNNERAKK